MTYSWRQRLQSIMDERGLSMKELSLAAGLGETAVRDLLQRKQSPRIDTLQALATALGMSVSQLYEGDEGVFQKIPVIGSTASGEAWDGNINGKPIGEEDLRIDGEAVALEVRGHVLMPHYRDGDLIIGVKRGGNAVDNLIGMDCIIVTEDGSRYVKFLGRGSMRGRYNLRSFDPSQPDITNVRIMWAAPIAWIRRGAR